MLGFEWVGVEIVVVVCVCFVLLCEVGWVGVDCGVVVCLCDECGFLFGCLCVVVGDFGVVGGCGVGGVGDFCCGVCGGWWGDEVFCV